MFEQVFKTFICEIAVRVAAVTGDDIETAFSKVAQWANQNTDEFVSAFSKWSARAVQS